MIKYFLLSFFILTSLCSNVNKYDFIHGDFEKIKRFEMLSMDKDGIKSSSETLYKDIVLKIKDYINDSKNIRVTIVGYTDRPTDSNDEVLAKSDTFISKIQNIFRYSLSTKESESLSKMYAELVEEKMIDDGIDPDFLLIDSRGGRDTAYSEMTQQGRELSNRVMVTAYIISKEILDSDLDGVSDEFDRCSGTIKGLSVDKNGCPLDDDNDGVYNYLDRCLSTKVGLTVNKYGCAVKTN